MPNKHYLKGRAFEYKVKKRWNEPPFTALRTAGSHSPFDVIAYVTDQDRLDFRTLKPGSTVEKTATYTYTTYITPIYGYGVQCKVKRHRPSKRTGGV